MVDKINHAIGKDQFNIELRITQQKRTDSRRQMQLRKRLGTSDPQHTVGLGLTLLHVTFNVIQLGQQLHAAFVIAAPDLT